MGVKSFVTATALCTAVFSSQLAMAAVSVEINDGNGAVLCTGNLLEMSTTPNQVAVAVAVGMDGNCGSGGGNLSSAQIDMGSIDEGSYTALTETILDGVTLTPPIAIQLDPDNLPAVQDAVVSIGVAENLTYNVSYSAANVQIDNNTTDSFGIIVSDATDQSATLTFTVTVNDAAAPPPPPSGDCTPTSTIICKGELDLTVNGEQYSVPIDLNTTHVWAIRPKKRDNYENFIFDYLSGPMTVSLSTSYARDSAAPGCTKTVKTGNLYLNTANEAFQCHAQPDAIYYLRVTSPASGRYSVFY